MVSAVAAAVRLVIRSSPISASSRVMTASVTKNRKEKATAERMMSSCTGRPLYWVTNTPLGWISLRIWLRRNR